MKKVKIIVISFFILMTGILHSCAMKEEQDKIMLETSLLPEETEIVTDGETPETGETGQEVLWYVYVAGCVKNPGVYTLPPDARVYHAIEKAGGFTEDADQTSLNLAAGISDGEKLVVYSKEEAAVEMRDAVFWESAGKNEKLVNINTAGKEELMTLAGIGESKAEAIISYRQEHGGFQKIEDIMNISGIKEGAFEKIKNFITV